ncbi:MAG TPA: hypothetical protein VF601_23530 [Beijerinckiaceae bacterium]|jgi:hypothetical protein
MTAIKPGDFVPATHDDYSDFIDSMADRMDHELDRLMRLDDPIGGEIGLSFDNTDKDVRARRRLFVAIARGVVLHLRDRHDAIAVNVPDAGGIVHPTFDVAATSQSQSKP